MVRRTFSVPVWCLVLCAMSAGASICNATVPVLLSAVSRMTHGTTPYDVLLPLSGGTGIECRTVANGLTIVATFDQAVVSGGASAMATTGSAIAGTPTFSGSTMTIPLTGLSNFQTITITLTLVKNAGGDTMASATIPLRTLTGNVKGSGTVTGSDVNVVRAAVASGVGVNGSNFRCDINAIGALTGSDVNIIRLQAALGSTVAGGATNDTAPTFTTTVPTQNAVSGSPSTPAGFTVASTTAAMTDVFVVASTSDPVTIPVANVSITGNTASRSISITPATGVTVNTTVTITLMVTDGLMNSTSSFTVMVTPPPTTYLATLQPVSGTNSFGSGSATLVLSGDHTNATVTYSSSNLSGTVSDVAVYAPGDDVLLDIGMGSMGSGTKVWTFTTTLTNTIAFTLQTIQNNQAYLTIQSSKFAGGELTGVFQLVTGSQSFSPPPAPPSITINPPTAADASRFFQQAGFGGMSAEISNLSNAQFSNAHTAINDWLTNQFNSQLPIYPSYGTVATVVPSNSGTITVGANAYGATTPYTFSPSSMYAQIYLRTTQAQAPNAYGDSLSDDRIHESWYKNVIGGYGNNQVMVGADQLRQRIATAYSEIFVISQIDDNIDGNTMGNACYYDMLANDAFANFRQIIGDVTLNPCMGEYLNMAGNSGATGVSPNENYAREIMQLFTVGLYLLQPDGTLMLDINGQPIPTYSQSAITEFAKVYTGWNYGASVNCPTLSAPNPPTFPNPYTVNVGSSLCVPMVVTSVNNHSKLSKTLLSYTGAATYPGASQPNFIPANASQTVPTVTAELNFALDNIFNHPNCGPFFCKRLIQRLVESNPSPAYVYRVAQVFANDGTGTRGNMQAVITAILTDYEARSPDVLSLPGYGHQREPMIRMVNIMRSLQAKSLTGKYMIGKTDTALAQTIFRSPTVFNFFDPAYQQPGVVQQAGLVSPEMDIVYETTIINAQNMIYTGVYSNYNASGQGISGTGFRGDNESNDVYLDFSTSTGAGLLSLAQSPGTNAMVNQVILLLGSSMDPNGTTQASIVSFIGNNFTATDYINQVKAAVYLVASSSQCSVQR